MELDKVDTVFVVKMENRSFHHMLGYLELSPYNKLVVGIKDAWLKNFVNRTTDRPTVRGIAVT